jgi:hypothetical protein
MDDDNAFTRCDYCGTIFPVRQRTLSWRYVETLDDGRGMFTTGIYCSEPCGEWSANRVGASRG